MNHVHSYIQLVYAPWEGNRSPPWCDFKDSPQPPLEYEDFGYPFIEPWFEGKEIIIWLLGWIREGEEEFKKSIILTCATLYKRLCRRGYKGRLSFFRWDTSKTMMIFGMKRSEYFSLKFGATFKEYVGSIPTDIRKHVTGHSTACMTIQGGKDSPTPYREKAFAFVRLKDDTDAALLNGVRIGRYYYFFIEGIWNSLGETDLR